MSRILVHSGMARGVTESDREGKPIEYALPNRLVSLALKKRPRHQVLRRHVRSVV